MTGRLPNPAFLICIATMMACSSESAVSPSGGPPAPPRAAPVLTTLRVVPEQMAIQPGSSQQVTLMALDQTGAPMDISNSVSFTTDMPGVAQVDGQGNVTGLVPGTVKISATVALGLSVKVAQATAFVRDSIAFPDVVLIYGREGWTPYEAPVRAGTIVEWMIDPAVSPTSAGKIYVMNSSSVVIDSVFLRGAPGLRRFATPGTFSYCLTGCTIPFSGKVTVK